MTELVFENIQIMHRKEQAFLSFSMRLKNGKRKKYCGIGVFQVLNPDHKYYGKWTLSSYLLFKKSMMEFYDTKEEAIIRAEEWLNKMNIEYKSGCRNWWTGKTKYVIIKITVKAEDEQDLLDLIDNTGIWYETALMKYIEDEIYRGLIE